MSQINLNTARQVPLAATHPHVPQTAPLPGMSTTAKIISFLALAFFATFAYIAFSRWNTPPNTKKLDENEDRIPPLTAHPVNQEKLQREIAALNGVLWEFELPEDKAIIRQSFIEARDLTTDLKERLISFVAQLRYDQPNVKLPAEVKRMTDPERNRIAEEHRQQQAREYAAAQQQDREIAAIKKAESLRADEMNAALNPLLKALQEATATLEDRNKKLLPIGICRARFALTKQEATRENVEAFEKRHKVIGEALEALKDEAPIDQFGERVSQFNAAFKEDRFEGNRTELQKAYQTYLKSIESVVDYLEWKNIREAANKDSKD